MKSGLPKEIQKALKLVMQASRSPVPTRAKTKRKARRKAVKHEEGQGSQGFQEKLLSASTYWNAEFTRLAERVKQLEAKFERLDEHEEERGRLVARAREMLAANPGLSMAL